MALRAKTAEGLPHQLPPPLQRCFIHRALLAHPRCARLQPCERAREHARPTLVSPLARPPACARAPARSAGGTASVTSFSSLAVAANSSYAIPFAAPCINCLYGIYSVLLALQSTADVTAQFTLAVLEATLAADGSIASLAPLAAPQAGSLSRALSSTAAYVSLDLGVLLTPFCGPDVCTHALVLTTSAPNVSWRMTAPCGAGLDSPVPGVEQPLSLHSEAGFIAHYPSRVSECCECARTRARARARAPASHAPASLSRARHSRTPPPRRRRQGRPSRCAACRALASSSLRAAAARAARASAAAAARAPLARPRPRRRPRQAPATRRRRPSAPATPAPLPTSPTSPTSPKRRARAAPSGPASAPCACSPASASASPSARPAPGPVPSASGR